MPLAILSPNEVRVALSAQHPANLPWALIKDSVFEFMDSLRGEALFFVYADDSDTANVIHPAIQDGKLLSVTVLGGTFAVLSLTAARSILHNAGAKKFGTKWVLVQDHMLAFVAHLYKVNYFLATAELKIAPELLAQTAQKNLRINLRKSQEA
jgi:uncharacterized membrane protein YsdA (DUF1294 family)